MYKTTCSQDLKLETEDKWVRHWNCCITTSSNFYKSLLVGYLWSRLLWHIFPLSMPVLVVAVGDYHPVFCLPFDFRFLLLDSIENVFSRTCVLPNIECIFNAKSFSSGNLTLLPNWASFQNAMPLDTHESVKPSDVLSSPNSLSNYSQLALCSDLAVESENLLMHSSAEDFICAKLKYPAWKTLLSSVSWGSNVDKGKAPCWNFLFSKVAVKQRTLHHFYFLTAASVRPK